METYYTDEQSYDTDPAGLRAIEAALSEGVAGASLAASGADDNFEVSVTSETGNVFTIGKAAGGDVTRSCTNVETKGGCGTDLEW
jgi:hypothetical protein